MKVLFDEVIQSFPPEVPPEIPVNPPIDYGATTAPVPIVYEKEPIAKFEYRVLTLSSPQSDELEATLNAAGHEGWWLAQIIHQEAQILLVLMRQA